MRRAEEGVWLSPGPVAWPRAVRSHRSTGRSRWCWWRTAGTSGVTAGASPPTRWISSRSSLFYRYLPCPDSPPPVAAVICNIAIIAMMNIFINIWVCDVPCLYLLYLSGFLFGYVMSRLFKNEDSSGLGLFRKNPPIHFVFGCISAKQSLSHLPTPCFFQGDRLVLFPTPPTQGIATKLPK